MEFRILGKEDAEELSEYVHPIWVETYAPIIYGGMERAENIFDKWVGPDKVRKDMDSGHFYAYIMVDGERAGLVSAGKEGKDLEISKLYVAPEYRRRHLGLSALEHLMEIGRRDGCTRAVLEVNPKNEHAIALYRRFGFEEIDRKEYDVGYTLIMAVDL